MIWYIWRITVYFVNDWTTISQRIGFFFLFFLAFHVKEHEEGGESGCRRPLCFLLFLSSPSTHPKTPLMSWLLFAKDSPTIIRSWHQHFHWHCWQSNLCCHVLIVCCCSQQYLPTGYTKCDLTAKGKGWAQDHFLPHISFLCHNHLTSKICWNIISAISPNIMHLKLQPNPPIGPPLTSKTSALGRIPPRLHGEKNVSVKTYKNKWDQVFKNNAHI